jgi:hypothetical protein
LAGKLWDLWKINRKYILLGTPLPATTSTVTHDIEDIDEKDLMELADNSEEDEEDWGKDVEDIQEKDKPSKKKRARTDIPVSANKPAPVAKNKPTPKPKVSNSKTKGSTFVKPLPLHIQSLSSLKPKTAPAPSIESLIASMPSSSSQSVGSGVFSYTPVDTFSIEIISWATVILHDTQLQALFHHYLIALLQQLCERSQLPLLDENLQNILLLCQYNFFHDSLYHDLNQPLLRQILPLIMLLALDSSPETTCVQFDQTLLEEYLKNEGEGGVGGKGSSMNTSLLYEFFSKTLSTLREKLNQTAILNTNTTKTDHLLGSLNGGI